MAKNFSSKVLSTISFTSRRINSKAFTSAVTTVRYFTSALVGFSAMLTLIVNMKENIKIVTNNMQITLNNFLQIKVLDVISFNELLIITGQTITTLLFKIPITIIGNFQNILMNKASFIEKNTIIATIVMFFYQNMVLDVRSPQINATAQIWRLRTLSEWDGYTLAQIDGYTLSQLDWEVT